MSLRFRRLKHISRVLPHIFQGKQLQQSRGFVNLRVFSSVIPLLHPFDSNSNILRTRRFDYQRFSTTLEVSNECFTPQLRDLLSFVRSSLDEELQEDRCWLNTIDGKVDSFKKDGTFLVLAGHFVEDSQIVSMLEKVKLLQQRFPWLHVMGFHSGSSICSDADQIQLLELIMREYITFPILLSKKNLEMGNGLCCILFKDFENPVIYHEKDLDLGIFNKAIEELNVQENMNLDYGNAGPKLKTSWVKQAEVIKEPPLCSSLQNLLLHFPGCVSADESGNRLFLSDSNHHRIIVFDDNGKILDSIGSCPGFEDGGFESAKLARPAASFYDDAEDCLYIVDSENHAIRRADLERRVLETLYPTCSFSKKKNSIWTWITNLLGFRNNVDVRSEEVDSRHLVFPWHLLKTVDDTFLIISQSFENLWVMDLASGEIKESIKGFPNILETCGQLITEEVSLLKQIPISYLEQQNDVNCSLKEFPYAPLISTLTTFNDHIVICDTVAHRVLKISRESGACSNVQLSNFGILGLPYWLSFPVERVYSVAGASADHLERFSLLPGRIDIRINVDIPMDTELVEPLQEGCIWRQARGAATEVLGAKHIVGSSEKVGVSQQWYDELDNLAFSTPGLDMTIVEDNASSDVKSQDGKIHIDCAVNTSPGTSEVIIYAALYLKLRKHLDLQEDAQQKYAARIADILNLGRGGEIEKDSFIQILLKSNSNLGDLIFVEPLHVRINLDSLDHPKADNAKDIILTDSAIEVNVSLEK